MKKRSHPKTLRTQATTKKVKSVPKRKSDNSNTHCIETRNVFRHSDDEKGLNLLDVADVMECIQTDSRLYDNPSLISTEQAPEKRGEIDENAQKPTSHQHRASSRKKRRD
ncbi:hypothetical protein TNCV_2372031 [Trichonephila clavipes]|nr:hypothetical protein TNCV_2372031 [Trichonephila clavipes]